MKVLRETRAKIDPQLLAAMKERLSGLEVAQAIAKPLETPPLPSSAEGKASYPVNKFDVPDAGQTEPVDKQKIAQIVLQYMKNREDGQKH